MKTLRAWLLEKLVCPQHRAVLAALEKPDRYFGEAEFTKAEIAQFRELLRSPLMQKLDLAMVNLAQGQAQKAIQVAGPEAAHACGVAWGYRAAWQQFKSISTLAVAEDGTLGADGDTAPADLARFHP